MPFLKTKPVVIETVVAVAGQPYRTPDGFKEYPAGTVLRLEEVQDEEHLLKVGFFYAMDPDDVEDFFEEATEEEYAAFVESHETEETEEEVEEEVEEPAAEEGGEPTKKVVKKTVKKTAKKKK